MINIDKTKELFGYDPTTLTKGSNKSCICTCDYCGDLIEKKYFKHINGTVLVNKDSCNKKSCRLKKQEDGNLIKIGVRHHSQTKEYKDKFKKTCLERYGIENPFQDKEKIKKIVEEKYGVSNVSKLEAVSAKRKKTNLERYGAEYPYQNPDILAKVHKKNLEKYGTEHFAKTSEFREEFSERNKLSYEEIIDFCSNKKYIPLFDYGTYEDSRQNLLFECSVHGIAFTSQVHYISHSREDHQCPKCKLSGTSKGEQELFAFVSSLGMETLSSDRKTIAPYELDVFVPSKNIALEYHGLYWHSEERKEKEAHVKKFQACKEKGIQLIQIYEDEWRDKQDICKSLIMSKLGIYNARLFSRKLKVIESNKSLNHMFEKFFQNNHLQGNTRFAKCFGLIDEQGIIQQAISLRFPYATGGKSTIEIARFATTKNTLIVGGFSRLMKYTLEWAKKESIPKVMTYSDCRYSWGKVYDQYGFILKGTTKTNYDYTDFVNRFGRFKYRANGEKSEKQVAKENNVFRIYGAGNYRWELPL